MATADRSFYTDFSLDHIRFYVDDLPAKARHFVDGYGFQVHAAGRPAGKNAGTSLGLGAGRIRLVLTEPPDGDHPGAAYLHRHGDGVADIALGVPDAADAFRRTVARGARPVAEPAEHAGITTAAIGGFGDVVHTFVQRREGVDERALPDLGPVTGPVAGPVAGPGAAAGGRLTRVDHLAVCVEPGRLDATAGFYRRVLGFEETFSEFIGVGDQGMRTTVVQSRSGAVTLTLIEPDASGPTGHVGDFLKDHDGPGVQHLAFATDDIVEAVRSIGARGVEFLPAPGSYYDRLPRRVAVSRHPAGALRELNVLVDEDHDGQLFQIFTRSVHPRKTFFTELIERLGSRSFGSGNIRALYQAVESQKNGPAG